MFLSLIAPFLYLRGWTFERLGIRPSLRGCFVGGVLALIAYGMYFRLAVLAAHSCPAIHRALIHTHIAEQGLSWAPIVLSCLINGSYEEMLVCGYVISAFAERGTEGTARSNGTVVRERDYLDSNAFERAQPASASTARLASAVIISVAIRTFYHLYQGIPGLIAIIPMGLLFGIWFACSRRLWPLIVAHVLMDFIGLTGRVR